MSNSVLSNLPQSLSAVVSRSIGSSLNTAWHRLELCRIGGVGPSREAKDVAILATCFQRPAFPELHGVWQLLNGQLQLRLKLRWTRMKRPSSCQRLVTQKAEKKHIELNRPRSFSAIH
ncbi:hypothetical protein BOX15_Mlig022448g1 [Macrostomum lignano]|uniref:Uncharacterized protein n=1 Tax=Macrostomum lignano TaxID=282301 RepID=A0A267F1K5_9PLAT|nr:hypothetical protein BOX15_Mlig022448g1 [Macrostomum lignano]